MPALCKKLVDNEIKKSETLDELIDILMKKEFNDDQLSKIMGYMANKIIIPQWFNKTQLEEIVYEKISNEKFHEFRKNVSNYYCDSLSEEIRDDWLDFTKPNNLRQLVRLARHS